MTGDEYAQLGASIQAAIVARIKSVAPKARVMSRNPVNLDESQWVGNLRSDADLDSDQKKRVHAWIVNFAATDDPNSTTVRSIEPRFRYSIEVFYQHEFGTEGENSETRIRDEVLKVQFAFAGQPHFSGIAGVSKHTNLAMRLRLARLSVILHRGTGELTVELQPTAVF